MQVTFALYEISEHFKQFSDILLRSFIPKCRRSQKSTMIIQSFPYAAQDVQI